MCNQPTKKPKDNRRENENNPQANRNHSNRHPTPIARTIPILWKEKKIGTTRDACQTYHSTSDDYPKWSAQFHGVCKWPNDSS
jgi:hypothetical protein